DYVELSPPIERSEFLDDPNSRRELNALLSKHSGLFYDRNLDLNQKAYLTIAPNQLILLFDNLYRAKTGTSLPNIALERDRGDINTTRVRSAAKLFRWIYGEGG